MLGGCQWGGVRVLFGWGGMVRGRLEGRERNEGGCGVECGVGGSGKESERTLCVSDEAHQAARRRSKESVVFQVTGMVVACGSVY